MTLWGLYVWTETSAVYFPALSLHLHMKSIEKEAVFIKRAVLSNEKYSVSVIFVDFCPFKTVTMQPQTLIADIKHNSGETQLYAADSINSATEI